MSYSPNPGINEAIAQLLAAGLPPLPVAPKQDPRAEGCHHQNWAVVRFKPDPRKPEIQGDYCRIAHTKVGDGSAPVKGDYCRLDESLQPIGRFTGKNPSYLDSTGRAYTVLHRAYQKALPSEAELKRWFANPANGVGTLGGHNGIVWIDFDRKNYPSQEGCDRSVEAIIARVGSTWVERTGSGGWRVAVVPKQKPTFTNFALEPSGEVHIGEALFDGRFTVLAPTIHPNGNPYTRIGHDAPATVESLESIGIYPTKDEQSNQDRAARRAAAGIEAKPSDPSDNPWDIRNLSEYLSGYRIEGGYIECKCPVHNGVSDNSLSINLHTGQFWCWSGCDGSRIYKETKAIAIATGYKPAKNQKVVIDLKERYRLRSQQIQAQLNTLTIKPDVVLNQRYLGDLPVPKPGTIQVISSPCNTGKTTALGGIVRSHWEQYPQGKQLMIGSRNGLLRQTGFKIGIPHIQDLQGCPSKERAAGLCADSGLRFTLDSITPHTLLIFDEGDGTIVHTLEGGTLGDRQAEILEHIANLVNRVLELGGMVLFLEDGITDLPINFLKELTQGRFPIHLTVNEHQATPWESVEIATGFKSGFVSYIADRLTAGEKLLIPSSAQEFAEDLEWIVKNKFPHKKVIRVDSKTSELPLIKDFMRSPDALLQREKPDVLIYTSSAESGIDINYPGFDRVCAYLVNLEVRKQYQMLARLRVPVPRVIFTREFATHEDCISTDPSVILKEWERQKEHTAKLCNLESNLDTPEQGMKLWGDRQKEQFWNKWIAFYRARAMGSQARMEENLIDLLQRRGHPVTQCPRWGIDKDCSIAFQEGRNTRITEGVNLFSELDTSETSVESAHDTLNSNDATYVERTRAQKKLKQHQFPCCNFDDPQFVRKAIFEDKGRYLKATTLLWLTEHPAIASQIDRQAFKKQLDKPFVVLKRLKHNRGAVDTVGALLVKGLKELSDGREYRDSDNLVQQVHQAALDDSYNVKRFLGLNVKPEHTATQTVNKLLKKLGFTCDVLRKEGKRGSQVRIWAVTDSQCEHRQSIFASLNQKYAEWLKPNNEAGSSSVVTTSIKEESLIKIVTTDPPGLTNLPPDWASDFRSAWQDAQTPEAKTTILEAIAQCQQSLKEVLAA